MGAGLAGVATAWFLAKDGHEVVVLERETEVASRPTRACAKWRRAGAACAATPSSARSA
jgi:glycine/D-amino acid oxidase-like deaminating enzyme